LGRRQIRGLCVELEHASLEFQRVEIRRSVEVVDDRRRRDGCRVGPQVSPKYAIQGDITKAKTAYQDFITLWKAADPDIQS
jgi:hypothetical protein